MAENEELNFDFDPDNIPDTNTFWNDLDAYWHENRQFPEDTDQKLSKKADLIDGKIPSSQLPSYVDDVLEFDSFGDLPSPGEQGKIYITTNNNFQYRWSGSEYILISSISGTINTIPKFTGSNVIGNSNIIDNGTDTTISKGLRLNPDTVEVTNVGRFLNYIKNNSNETIFSLQTHYWNGSSFQATSYPNINIGQLAGTSSTGAETINIGRFAGQLNSGLSVINLGQFSGMYNSANYVNNLGLYSGQFNTGVHSNNLGYIAGRYNIGVYSNNLGYNAGAFNVSGYVNHLGANAGYLNTGLFVNSLGGGANRYNQGNYVNVFGQSSNYTFKENPAHFKNFDATAIDLISKTISLPAHGFGATNAYVNLKFTQGTSPITGINDGDIIQVKIVDGNTVAFSDTLTNGYVRQTHNITNTGTGTGHKFNAQLVYSTINIFGSVLEPTKSFQNIISGHEFLMPQSTVSTLDADTTNKTLITKEWFNSKIASYGIASNYYTKTESDGKFIPYTGANTNVNLNTRNFETSGRLTTGNLINNLASRTIQGTGIIDITLPNVNVMGVFYIDIFTYGALVGTFICQFYTFYGSSINFAGSNSVTFIGKNPNNVGVRYVSIGTNNNAERHIYIGDLATNWGNWTEISIRGLINVNHDAIKTNPPLINLITSEGSPLNNFLTFTDLSTETAKKLQTARTINGTSFDGTGNITTTNWGTSRNITIGNTTKTINGSGDASWSLAEIGAISDGSVLKVEGNGVAKHNLIGTDAFGLRNASAWATSTNRPNNTNSAVVNFTSYNLANQTYGFSLGARLNKLFFVTEENSTFGTWNEVYHTGNLTPHKQRQTVLTSDTNNIEANTSGDLYYYNLANSPYPSSQDIVGSVSNFGGKTYGYDFATVNLGGSRLYFRNYIGNNPGTWNEIFHNGNFNPANYVLQSALNTQLSNYATLNGVQTFTNTNIFSQSPIIPEGTLGNHAVNLNQADGRYVNTLYNQDVNGLKTFTGVYTAWLFNNDSSNGRGFLQSLDGRFAVGTTNDKDLVFYRNIQEKLFIGDTYSEFFTPLVVPNATINTHAVNLSQLSNAIGSHTHTFASLTSKPTTLSGYGITDAIPTSHPVNGVNTAQINHWNSAFGWGNHAAAGYATSDFVNENMAQINAEFINPDYPISASCKLNTVIITEEYTKEYLELEAELIPERQITVTNLAPFEINVRREDHSIDTIRTGETTEYYITAEKRLIKKGSYHSAAFLN